MKRPSTACQGHIAGKRQTWATDFPVMNGYRVYVTGTETRQATGRSEAAWGGPVVLCARGAPHLPPGRPPRGCAGQSAGETPTSGDFVRWLRIYPQSDGQTRHPPDGAGPPRHHSLGNVTAFLILGEASGRFKMIFKTSRNTLKSAHAEFQL